MEKKDFRVNWNVIEGDEFEARLSKIFRCVADAITCTLGPYGRDTLIEEGTEMHSTKDGLQVIKSIQFDNTMANNILKIIKTICYNMMLKVGDGTSSSIVGADKLYQMISEDKKLSKLRSRDLDAIFSKVKELICEEIVGLSEKIEPGDSETIYKIASISSNNDEFISNMMKDIYSKVQYPIINYTTGLGFKTTYEIVSGFKLSAHYLDACYRTNDKNECHMENPLIMIFDHKIDYDTHYTKLIKPIKDALLMHAQLYQVPYDKIRKVCVIAPYFDEELLEHLRQDYAKCQMSNFPLIDVYVKGYASNTFERQELEDLSAFCRCHVIKEDTIKRMRNCVEFSFDLEDVGNPNYCPEGDFGIVSEQVLIDAYVEGKELDQETKDKLVFETNMYVGSVKKLVVTDRQNNYALIEEFDCPDTKRIETLTLDAQANLNQSNEESKSRLVVHSDLNNMKKRLGRLRGEIVNITIGAETELAKNYQQDVIDDVVKACDCATKFGYNIGGNLIIPIAIKNILNNNKDLTESERDLLCLTDKAFKNVFATVLGNRYNNPRYWNVEEDGVVDIDEIISDCISNKVCYDLVQGDYSENIINPSYTDIEIINSTFHIISMMNNTNQYITEKIDITALSKSIE